MSLFHREFGGLHEAAFLLGFFAILSQFMAVIRDRLFAHKFGAGEVLDIYNAAFRIPDILFVSIASFVAITVIMPFLIDRMTDDIERAQQFINSVFTVFFTAIVAVCAAVFFAVPTLVELIFQGFNAEAQLQIINLTRILLLSPILLGVSNILASITQAHRKFFVYALSPVLYNLGIILGLLLFYETHGLVGLGYGVVLGALLHMAIQIPVVLHQRLLPRPTIAIDWPVVKEVLLLALPRTIGLSVHQIALLVLISLASVMAVGSITVFQFAFNLQSVPLSIIGVSYSVAAFPTLARLISKKKTKQFCTQILAATRHIIFWSLPMLFLFIVLRAQIVRTLLGSGEFSWADTRLTAAALALFAISIVAQSLVLLFVRGYYAAGNTRTPVITNVLSAAFIIFFAYAFNNLFQAYPQFQFFVEALLRVENVSGTEMLGLPLAYSVGMILNAIILWKLFKRDFHISRTRRVEETFRQSLYASFAIAIVSYNLLDVFDDYFDLDTFLGVFMQGFLSGMGGLMAGVMLLIALKSSEAREIWHALHNKFWKSKVVAPDKEQLN
jgi:putative peptidoglycan lipid II flippase